MKWYSVFLITLLSAMSLAVPRSVSNEDIKEAILSLVRTLSDFKDKLERHEYRERQLGDQLKKALSTLDKRERAQDHVLENIMTKLNKIDERIQKVENSTKMTDREKGTYTIDSDPIQSWMSNVEGMLQQTHSKDQFVDINQLKTLELSINSRLDDLSLNVEKLETNLVQSSQIKTSNLDTEKLFDKMESQLVLQSKWHNSILKSLETHERILSDLQKNPENEIIANITKEIEFLKSELVASFQREVAFLQNSVENLHQAMYQGQENIVKSLARNNDVAEGFYEIYQKSYEKLETDLKALETVEKVLVQTADNVMDTKRRIEYGIERILLEVGEVIKLQGTEINTTMNKRFDGISETILDNQNGGLTNLSSKIETEISQVWRQIGIMYQQLTASAGTLDKLQQQTETYVNGSLHTMDSMEGKVVQITGRMTDVDENLNYLLGRFSLVTQEFNQIKAGLATALDNMRSSFQNVQQQIKEVQEHNPLTEDSNTL